MDTEHAPLLRLREHEIGIEIEAAVFLTARLCAAPRASPHTHLATGAQTTVA